MTKERRLGRGLEALLGRVNETAPTPVSTTPPPVRTESGRAESQEIDSRGVDSPNIADLPDHRLDRDDSGQLWLDVYAIDRNPYQPRSDFNEESLRSLIDSIKKHGVLQPLVVRKLDERYQLITGERRLRAATAAGWDRVPVQIRTADDRQMAELAIVENVQRKDLNPIEKAESFRRYIDDYGVSQEELASRIDIDRSTISNLIRLLDLPDGVKSLVRTNTLAASHARALLPLGDDREQELMVERIRNEGFTVRATEDAVRQRIRRLDAEPFSVIGADGRRRPIPRTQTAHVGSLEQELRTVLGTKVDIKQTSRGRGRITIHFKDESEFERLRKELTTKESRPQASGQ